MSVQFVRQVIHPNHLPSDAKGHPLLATELYPSGTSDGYFFVIPSQGMPPTKARPKYSLEEEEARRKEDLIRVRPARVETVVGIKRREEHQAMVDRSTAFRPDGPLRKGGFAKLNPSVRVTPDSSVDYPKTAIERYPESAYQLVVDEHGNPVNTKLAGTNQDVHVRRGPLALYMLSGHSSAAVRSLPSDRDVYQAPSP